MERFSERLGHVERAIDNIQKSNERIATSLERLVVLETKHAETRAGLDRAFKAIGRIDARVDEVEGRMPVLGIVTKIVLWSVTAAGAASVGFVWWKATGMTP